MKWIGQGVRRGAWIGVIGATGLLWAGAGLAPPPPPIPSPLIGDCHAKRVGQSHRACWVPPTECPNGPFTGFEDCHGTQQSFGCPGETSVIVEHSVERTGLTAWVHSCDGNYMVMMCRCNGNIFGWCVGPCVPTGGVISRRDCWGGRTQLRRCEEHDPAG